MFIAYYSVAFILDPNTCSNRVTNQLFQLNDIGSIDIPADLMRYCLMSGSWLIQSTRGILALFDGWFVTHSEVTWLIYMWHDSFRVLEAFWIPKPVAIAAWLIQSWHDSFLCDRTHLYVTWLIYMGHDSFMYDMTHSQVTRLILKWHDSFIWDMTHLGMTWLIPKWHDSFPIDMTHLYGTWLIYVWHDSFICWWAFYDVFLCWWVFDDRFICWWVIDDLFLCWWVIDDALLCWEVNDDALLCHLMMRHQHVIKMVDKSFKFNLCEHIAIRRM